VNRAVDPMNLTDLEKEHLPVITAPVVVKAGEHFEVTVEVGRLLTHPNERGHFVGSVEVYADELRLARIDLAAVNLEPKVTFVLSLREPVRQLHALGRCNLHGAWGSAVPITVAE
jgi:superoxide reductase